MKLKTLNRSFALAGLTLLAATALAPFAGINVGAKTTSIQDQTSNGEVVIYANSAAPSTTPGDGTQIPGLEAAPPVTMSNITFTATKYTGSGVPSGPTDAAFNGAVVTQTTDSSAMADFTGLTDGYYLFHQITTVGGITTVADFIVQVNTTDSKAGVLNVYPKMNAQNSSDLGKVATNPNNDVVTGTGINQLAGLQHVQSDKTTDTDVSGASASDTGKQITAASGQTVTFNINSIFDQSQVTNITPSTADTAGSYVITDTFPTTGLIAGAPVVNVTNSTGSKVGTLAVGTDYTVSGTYTITLTTAGQLNAANMLGHQTGLINVQIPATVQNNYVGAVTNTVSTTITNAFGVDLSKTAQTVVVNVGGVDVKKVDSSSTALPGATFVLVKAANLADAQALVKANASAFNNSTANISGLPTTPQTESSGSAEFVKDASGAILQSTTGTDGLATFGGLDLSDNNTDGSNTTNFFAVEVAAPTGYQLPSATTGANVTLVSASVTPTTNGTTSITNSKPFALPFTGGSGIAAILIIATVAGVGAIVIRKRRKGDEEA